MSHPDETLISKQHREETRKDKLTDGFIGEGTVKIAGHELRPFTFGSLTLCRKLKLTLFTDESTADQISDTETMRQLAVFFWFQSQPVGDVLSAVRAGNVTEAVDAFEFNINIHSMPSIMRRIRQLSELAAEAAVEIEEKPNSQEGDTPPN